MSKENNGGPAFPNKTEATGWDGLRSTHFEHKGGMTLRDYFAAKAMIAIGEPASYVGAEETKRSYKAFASKAYKLADAMLEARNK